MAIDYSIGIKVNGASGGYEDLFLVYGVRLLRGGYEQLLTPATLKDYVTNESRLEHGTRYIPVNARYKERSVSLEVVLTGSDYDDYLAKYEALMDLLTSGLVLLRVPRLKRVYKFVYIGASKFKFNSRNRATFILEFKEPDVTDRPQISA